MVSRQFALCLNARCLNARFVIVPLYFSRNGDDWLLNFLWFFYSPFVALLERLYGRIRKYFVGCDRNSFQVIIE